MLYRDLTVLENLVFFGRLYDVRCPLAEARDLLDQFGIAGRADDAVSSLSRGLVQRVAIARALIHSPELLIADEPFTGLDAVATGTLIDCLAALRRRGTTIILSDHDAARARAISTRILRLDGGRLIEPAMDAREVGR